MTPRTIANVIAALPRSKTPKLPAPPYRGEARGDPVGFAVESMKRHMSNEGWEIFAALEHAGYKLVGRHLPRNETDVSRALRNLDPHTVVMQDEREWDVLPHDFRDPAARFNRTEALADGKRFVLTILKDSHQRPDYHRASAERMGAHAWIVYYAPQIVQHLAPYVRPEHLIRTYHTVDPSLVPSYTALNRQGCLLSGAVSNVYPLRARLFKEASKLPETTVLRHPGYHRHACATPDFLKQLSRHKVSICTASIYGYLLRKVIESIACGCIVLTDLPSDEVVPEVDMGCVRIHPDTPTKEIAGLLRHLCERYDPERQRFLAEKALLQFDYRTEGLRLASQIESLRQRWN